MCSDEGKKASVKLDENWYIREPVAPMLLVITSHLFVASSRQRFYDRLRCEEESGKSTLIDLINQVQDIKNYFTTSYQTVVSYPDRPPKQKQYQTIRANKEYALWRARIEAELGTLTQDRTVDDIYKLFAFIEKGYSDRIILLS